MNFSPSLNPRAGALLLVALGGCSSQAIETSAAPVSASAPSQISSKTIHLEAEEATLNGVSVATKRGGFSGTGYVTGFDADGDRLVWTLPQATAGIYQVSLRYSAPFGQKGFDMVVNGTKTSGMLAATEDVFAASTQGKVELKSGANTITIEKGWGFFDVDALDLVPVSGATELKNPPATLSDPKADAPTRALMSGLVALYGQKTLSGQQRTKDIPYVVENSGQTPAILGGDLMDYSPSRVEFGAKPEGTVENLIQNQRDGHIITISWHWNAPSGLLNKTYTDAKGKQIEAPWWRGFYTDASTFDLQKALADPNSADYKLLIRDMDAIAVELQKLQKAGVPVLWRPLHEAEGGWFWWGAKGPEPFKQLWNIMFDRFTQKHELHNLIWVYTSGGDPKWYPGDNRVDIVGTDAYPKEGDLLSGIWDKLNAQFGGKKLLALSEIGGVPDVEGMRRFGTTWSYFMTWEGTHGPTSASKPLLAKTYRSPFVVNHAQLSAALRPQAKP